MTAKPRKRTAPTLSKIPTGIQGLDEVTGGGLPTGRTTLVCGGAGCGKTLFGMEFLVRGALDYNEPGVCLSFEESAEDLVTNVASLGFDLQQLIDRKKLVIDAVQLDRSHIEETGEYDLEGLFVRLDHAIKSIGARRVLLDTVETLFSGLQNAFIIRSELRRLFGWLTDKGVTAIVTGERGEGTLTRNGLEEYISDCVILLDHRIQEAVFTRRLRIVKYRGSTHGTNEYPFLIGDHGLSVFPITSVELTYPAAKDRISTGIPALDRMLGGKGFYRGSTVLLSGSAGTGKTTFAAHFADSVCARGERCVFFSFEESPEQLARNMRSVGIDLDRWAKRGLLTYCSARPTMFGLEMHLVRMHNTITELQPAAAVVDPISGFMSAGPRADVTSVLLRLIDTLRQKNITAFLTHLISPHGPTGETELSVSSIVDTWFGLRDLEVQGERNRGIFILKSRGIAHSKQVHEFLLTSHGVDIKEAYIGAFGGLTGSARVAQEARDREALFERKQEAERRVRELARKRKTLEAQIAALQMDVEADDEELRELQQFEQQRAAQAEQSRAEMVESRKPGPDGNEGPVPRRGRKK